MKTWFVFLIDGKKVGTWANSAEQGKQNLVSEFGNVPMEYVGMYVNGIGEKPEKYSYTGMSGVDVMIASGLMNFFNGIEGKWFAGMDVIGRRSGF